MRLKWRHFGSTLFFFIRRYHSYEIFRYRRQAVIEGIMMKNKDQYATAVRRPDGGIEVKKDTYVSMTEKVPFCGLPFVRGVFSFADSMILGMRTLSFSASFFEDDEDSEPGKLELWMDKVFGRKWSRCLWRLSWCFPWSWPLVFLWCCRCSLRMPVSRSSTPTPSWLF